MTDYEKEHNELMRVVSEVSKRVTMADENKWKYPPYSYKQKTIDEHITRGERHLKTWKLQQLGVEPDSPENHFYHAIVRFMMALYIMEGCGPDSTV